MEVREWWEWEWEVGVGGGEYGSGERSKWGGMGGWESGGVEVWGWG